MWTYRLWKSDPNTWDSYFRRLKSELAANPSPTTDTMSGGEDDEETIREYLVIQRLISSFQRRGHLAATLDPLGIVRGEHLKPTLMQKHIMKHCKLPEDMIKMYRLQGTDHISGGKKYLRLSKILKRLADAYCGNIGIEYMYILNQDKLNFIRFKFETPGILKMIGPEEKKLILKRLIRAQNFEASLAKRFPSEKRFGLEGGEVLIPAVNCLIDTASALGVDSFNIGIAHRGRLNILANVLGKPLADIFAQFRGVDFAELGSGDIKYHLGTSVTRVHPQTKRPVTVAVLSNPSHLEAINPIVLGKTYAERMEIGDERGEKVWPVLIHGDAATTGQGLVYETFHLSELPSFTNHGSIHIIINNQIGFTTDPRVARSSVYCTEVAKVLSAPVFHVNGDDPEATCYVMKVAAEYKQKFKSDVVVDIYCYRRHGHSEMDDPKFTQPIMYKVIEKMKPVATKYTEKLLTEGFVNEADVHYIQKSSSDWLTEGFEAAEKMSSSKKDDWLESPWKNFFTPEKDLLFMPKTGADKDVLLKIGEAMSRVPEQFDMNQQLVQILQGRKEMIEKNSADWALGEAFAFGSLLQEGFNVRLTGQDVERGTFSQRHHVYHDQSLDQVTYKPLHNIFPKGGTYVVCNSSLSEFGVLGFQLGYSMVSPYNLVLWEAQFGDFANSAQIIIDQFLSAGEAKWGRQTALVLLLPHGLEGQGPEHSSAWPHRFLQMCVEPEQDYMDNMPQQMLDANWFIVNATTPANYFHVLRRQLKLNFRKNLVIFTPKSLLRHPQCRSSLDEMAGETEFKPYLKDDSITDPNHVERVLVCTGKVFYELKEQREQRNMIGKVALCRVEQLFPFPYGEVREDIKQYSNAAIFWVQEEHKNHGWWHYVQPRLTAMLGGNIQYIGRRPSAPPSTGNKERHFKEIEDIMNQCFP